MTAASRPSGDRQQNMAPPSGAAAAAPRTDSGPCAGADRWLPWPLKRPRRPLPAGLIVHMIAVIISSLGQTVVTVATWGQALDTAARTQTAVLAVGKLLTAYVVLLSPLKYWRRRAVVAPIVRIGFHLLPVVRGQGAGAALLLEREAQPGWRGALADLARVFAGMRHLGATVGGVALLMPPAITLATQSVLLLLVSNVPLYCGRPLLEHPLMQHRLGVVATGLELATMPLLVLQPLVVADSRDAASLLAGTASAEAVCRTTVSFMQVALVVLLPTCLSICSWDPAAERQQREPEHGGGSSSAWGRLLQRSDRAVAAANRALHAALSGPDAFGSRLTAVVWLLASTWWLCKWREGLH